MLVIVVSGIMSACGGSTPPAALPAVADEPFPEPVGDVLLTISADSDNDGEPEQQFGLDLAGIETTGTITRTIFEPFVSRDIEFTGVDAALFLARAGIEPDDPVTWRALDDYEVTSTRSELARSGAILATRGDGDLLPIEDGGPLRLVFTNPEGGLGRDTNQWIWSIAEVRLNG